jgi:hypothetical protein
MFVPEVNRDQRAAQVGWSAINGRRQRRRGQCELSMAEPRSDGSHGLVDSMVGSGVPVQRRAGARLRVVLPTDPGLRTGKVPRFRERHSHANPVQSAFSRSVYDA